MSYSFIADRKDPSAVLRHEMDWIGDGWLADGETITAETVVSSVPAELVIDQVAEAAGVVAWRVSGGTARKNYTVTVTITTSAGRIDQRSVLYPVRER
jgi:hypothetical protein